LVLRRTGGVRAIDPAKGPPPAIQAGVVLADLNTGWAMKLRAGRT
jgi:hypothetical protein